VSDEMLEWKSEGTRLYQALPDALRTGWRAVEPLRELPSGRTTQAATYRTWNETKSS
jgi:hypothetical protein